MGLTVSEDPLWQKVYEQPDALVETSPDRTLRRTLQPYSTDIAAAWEVVEKAHHYGVEKDENGKEFECVIFKHDLDEGVFYNYFGRADTAPLAISLAALKALGISEEEIERACA